MAITVYVMGIPVAKRELVPTWGVASTSSGSLRNLAAKGVSGMGVGERLARTYFEKLILN